jgi:hypothetical protein
MPGIRENGARIVALLMVQSGTAAELAARLAPGRATPGMVGNVTHWLTMFHDFGVVYVMGTQATRSVPARIWALQPTPFHFADNFKVLSSRQANQPSYRNASNATNVKATPCKSAQRARCAVSVAV